MTDARHFEPVTEAVERPTRLSQTLLRTTDNCPRAGYLYLKTKGGPSSAPMSRGSAFHKFAERMVLELIRRGEKSLFAPAQGEESPEALQSAARDVASLTQAMVESVFEDHPEYVMPAAERDHVRVMAYHAAVGFDVDPATVVGVERTFTLDVGDWQIIGKVDLASLPSATVGEVLDWKSSLHVPSQEEQEQSFQAKLYALLMLYGTPEGGEPFGQHLTHVRGRMVFPRARPRETDKGLRLVQRTATWNRGQLDEFRLDLEALGRRITAGLDTGDWPAQAGSHCSECPAPRECPIPVELRNHQGTVTSADEAAVRWEWALRAKAEVAAVEREVKAFAKEHGGFTLGDVVWEWLPPAEQRRLRSVGGRSDWDGLQAAVERAVQYGEPFEIEEFVRWTPKNTFGSRPIAAEGEMVDEQPADERSPDERWGADAPF